MRVTETTLKEKVGELNVLRGLPQKAFDEESGRWTKGAYDVRSMPDGYQVVMLKTITTGAVDELSPAPLCSAREVLAWIEGAIHILSIMS